MDTFRTFVVCLSTGSRFVHMPGCVSGEMISQKHPVVTGFGVCVPVRLTVLGKKKKNLFFLSTFLNTRVCVSWWRSGARNQSSKKYCNSGSKMQFSRLNKATSEINTSLSAQFISLPAATARHSSSCCFTAATSNVLLVVLATHCCIVSRQK